MTHEPQPDDLSKNHPPAVVEFDAEELRTAALAFLGAGHRLLKALTNGAVLEVEMGAGKPIRLALRPRRDDGEQ